MGPLEDRDLIRYNRQMILDGWGEDGQSKLKEARVFLAGAGGLGSPVAIYLTVAGVGEVAICDNDRVELSNLNRQILHNDMRIGQLKAESAGDTLRSLNPDITITTYAARLEEGNLNKMIGGADLVVDCLDNYETRYLLNRWCAGQGIPFVHGAVWGLMGQMTFLHPPETPCLECIFPNPPPKEVFPVVGVTPGVIGTLQAMETLKYLTGIGEILKGRLLIFDGDLMNFETVAVKRISSCPVCSVTPSVNAK